MDHITYTVSLYRYMLMSNIGNNYIKTLTSAYGHFYINVIAVPDSDTCSICKTLLL